MPKGQKIESVRKAFLHSVSSKLAGFIFNELDDMPGDIRDDLTKLAKDIKSLGDKVHAVEKDDASQASGKPAEPSAEALDVAPSAAPAKKASAVK